MVEEEMKSALEKWNTFLKEGGEPPFMQDESMPFKERFNKNLEEYARTRNKKLLRECALILKHWVSNKETLNRLLEKVEREKLVNILGAGKVEVEFEGDVETSELLKKLGIKNRYTEGKVCPAGEYEMMFLKDKLLLVEPEFKSEVERVEKEEREIATKIQVLNAKRQIMELSEDQMKEYEQLQKKYLEVSKQKITLLSKLAPPHL